MYDIEKLRREEFPLSQTVAYFNHASISPPPIRTRQKVKWSADRLSEHPMDHFMSDGRPMFEAFQTELAAYINAADPLEIVPITSTGSGINAVAQALAIQPGENIAFAAWEFPTNAYPWMSLERDGVEIRQVPAVHGGLTLEKLAEVVDERTKLVAASAVQFFSGHRTDLAAIGQFCHERGIIFSVDAIQAIGHMPIDVQALNIDILVTGGQKSIMALPGVGFMYVRTAVAEAMSPRMIGGNSTQNWIFWLDYDLTPLPAAGRFNGGTPNVPGMFAILESIGLINELGLAHIDHHTTGLAAYAIEAVADLGFDPITPREDHAAIVTFNPHVDEATADHWIQDLHGQNISLVKHLSPDGVPHLRISFHCYNTKDEIDHFKAIIKDYLP